MALCTEADVEQKLGGFDIPVAIDIPSLITDAQAVIEHEVGRPLESAARSELVDGAYEAVYVTFWPITAVDSLEEDGVALVDGTDFVWYPRGKIIRVSNGNRIVWKAHDPQSISIDYTGGYTAGPELNLLSSLCAEVAARAVRRSLDVAETPAGSSGPVQSVSLEGSDTVTYATSASTGFFATNPGQYAFLTEDEVGDLQRFKRIVVT